VSRGWCVAVALIASASLLGQVTSRAAAEGYEQIQAPGPIEAIALGDELACQVTYVNDFDYEFYPPDTSPGDCGTFLAVGGVLYAPDFDSHGRTATSGLGGYATFTPVSQTGVEGSGTAADPYRVTTVVDAGGSGIRIAETTSYVSGSSSYRIDTAVTNRGSNAVANAVLYHAGDCYASGSDIGFGFTRTEVGSAGCSQTAGNSPPGRTIQMGPLSATSSFYEAGYREVWERIATKSTFPDTCRCAEHVDNGVGLSWALSLGPNGEGTVRSLSVSFTESTPPAPGADSDGDALPDRWETGNSALADYENLASLGADPNRKDIFVHLDYMEGCKPPAGWERPAIQVFAEHGIALHVDSGPESINADGQPWGARSRAGAIPRQANIGVWGDFDRLKDQNFVPSNRRRAFHYAALVDKFDNGEGGLARSIPEADFVFAGCREPETTPLKRYVAIVFAHELGHNLGLRHGGGDDIVGKPNYYGIMNYFWAYFGGVSKKGVSGLLPNYSESKRPDLDERRVDESVPQIVPVAWNCPGAGKFDIRYEVGSGTRLIDWDCDGVYGELHRHGFLDGSGLNLNSSWGPSETLFGGFNDWRPGAISFAGGGVLGNFELLERPNTPASHELTPAEFVAAEQALKRSNRKRRRQLRVTANRLRLRAGRATALRILVDTDRGGKRVQGARIKVRGARLTGRNPARTGPRGKALLHLTPKRHEVRISVSRRGYAQGGLVLAVRHRQRHP